VIDFVCVSVIIQDVYCLTKSSAVTERPHDDALCVSVVSFNSTIRLLFVTSVSDLPLRTIKFYSVLFGVVVCTGWDKPRFTYALWSVWLTDVYATAMHGRPSIVDRTPAVIDAIARYLLRIMIFAYPPAFDAPPPLGDSLSEYCHNVWCGNTHYSVVATRWWKYFKDTFTHFYRIHKCDRRTDRRIHTTWWHSIARQTFKD